MSTESETPASPSLMVSDGDKLVSAAVEAWKTTVGVQQHFNDLELRVRNYAITFLTAVLGLVGLALKEEPASALPSALLGVGLLGWVSFYVMDRWWYHRFLEGAGEHAGRVEKWLEAATGTGSQVFNLSETVRAKSAVFIGKMKFRSKHRIDFFYGVVALAAIGLAWLFHSNVPPPKPEKPTEVILKAETGPIPISLPSLPACIMVPPAQSPQRVATPSDSKPPHRGNKRKP